jgi:hypothetical protein
MSYRHDRIQRFASKCRELADTCTTTFAQEALIETAERVEARMELSRLKDEGDATELPVSGPDEKDRPL